MTITDSPFPSAVERYAAISELLEKAALEVEAAGVPVDNRRVGCHLPEMFRSMKQISDEAIATYVPVRSDGLEGENKNIRDMELMVEGLVETARADIARCIAADRSAVS